MVVGRLFDPLPINEIERLTSLIESVYQPITILLIDGDLLIGCLAKNWYWNGETIGLGFNTLSGRRYGESHLVEIPLDVVADVQPFPLSESSTPHLGPNDPELEFFRSLGNEYEKYQRLPVQDYPNPMATIISNHNLPIAERHTFRVSAYFEFSLPVDGIPPEGIEFGRDYILYADTEFISQHISGASSVNIGLPILGVSKDLSPSLYTEVINLLKGTWFQNLHSPMSPSGIDERLIQGKIILPDSPMSTEIEGDNCVVVVFVPIIAADAESQAVLFKPSLLKYPLAGCGRRGLRQSWCVVGRLLGEVRVGRRPVEW